MRPFKHHLHVHPALTGCQWTSHNAAEEGRPSLSNSSTDPQWGFHKSNNSHECSLHLNSSPAESSTWTTTLVFVRLPDVSSFPASICLSTLPTGCLSVQSAHVTKTQLFFHTQTGTPLHSEAHFFPQKLNKLHFAQKNKNLFFYSFFPSRRVLYPWRRAWKIQQQQQTGSFHQFKSSFRRETLFFHRMKEEQTSNTILFS